jgi:alpha-methylacyl-CoA racemase
MEVKCLLNFQHFCLPFSFICVLRTMSVTAKQILESIPQRFRPEKAQSYSTRFHFDISGEETLQYTVEIKDNQCHLTQGFHGTPDCVIKTKASVYVDLETGKGNPQTAFMNGEIIVSNIAAMMQFAKCFRKFQPSEVSTDSSIRNPQSAIRNAKTGPLAGVKILDFTRLLPGPLATMFLADLGADVIKIEDPDNPDYIRGFEPRINGMSMLYLSLNRSKRSLAVNYLSAEGKEIIHNLVKNADVLVEQYRPGVMKELGFGYEELSKLNPRLIYVSVTGYGQDSSKAMEAGHDLNYIGIGGALGITGDDEKVVIPGFQLGDIAGGSYMAMNAVTAALYQREKTGKGDWVDVSMTDAVVPFNILQFASYQGEKQNIGRGDFQLSGSLANYNVYKCADGKFIALGSLEPKFWNKFCSKAGKPDWAERFLLKGEEATKLKGEVKDFFLAKRREQWLQYFKEEDICLTTINDISEIEHDAYLNERKMFVENEHAAVGKYKTINQPLKFKQTNFDNNWNAPDLGDDTEAILQELNYSATDISALKQKGIIKT